MHVSKTTMAALTSEEIDIYRQQFLPSIVGKAKLWFLIFVLLRTLELLCFFIIKNNNNKKKGRTKRKNFISVSTR